MTAVVRDPKVLSVLEKRGEKGCRELQGENLREMFIDMVAKQVSFMRFHHYILAICLTNFSILVK